MIKKTWNANSIKSERAKRGWNQKDLAKKLGTNQQMISEWETGRITPGNAYSQLLTILFMTSHED